MPIRTLPAALSPFLLALALAACGGQQAPAPAIAKPSPGGLDLFIALRRGSTDAGENGNVQLP